jgi:hypothetical protein
MNNQHVQDGKLIYMIEIEEDDYSQSKLSYSHVGAQDDIKSMRSLQSYKSKKSIKSEANLELRLEGHDAIIKAHRKGARSVRADHPLTV